MSVCVCVCVCRKVLIDGCCYFSVVRQLGDDELVGRLVVERRFRLIRRVHGRESYLPRMGNDGSIHPRKDFARPQNGRPIHIASRLRARHRSSRN